MKFDNRLIEVQRAVNNDSLFVVIRDLGGDYFKSYIVPKSLLTEV